MVSLRRVFCKGKKKKKARWVLGVSCKQTCNVLGYFLLRSL